jgi:hypothetical protein
MPATAAEVAQVLGHKRVRKAMALAGTSQAEGFSVDLVRAMGNHTWHTTATAAWTKPPSADTQALVIELMEQR